MKIFIPVIIFLNFNINSFSQKPKSGVFLLKYFDLEYNKFAGTCKLILNKDSVSVYAEKDCHRTNGVLIEKGLLVKNKSGNWIIYRKDEDMPSRIDFKKKFFYSF
jgi:hypothetical protein